MQCNDRRNRFIAKHRTEIVRGIHIYKFIFNLYITQHQYEERTNFKHHKNEYDKIFKIVSALQLNFIEFYFDRNKQNGPMYRVLHFQFNTNLRHI